VQDGAVSNIYVSKLDIDVLVHLALGGPAEAGSHPWIPLTAVPDSLGAQLWRSNHAVAGDGEPEPPEYRFVPLPFDPTAAEGVRQVHFYRYQTDSESGMPKEAVTLLRVLEERLVHLIPEVAGAPWGFGPEDLSARVGRPPSRLTVAPVEDHRIVELRERLDAAGLPLEVQAINAMSSATTFGVDTREIVARGHWFPPGTGGFSPVNAVLCDSIQVARRVYLDRCRDSPRSPSHDRRYFRFGALVMWTSFMLPSEDPSSSLPDQRGLAVDVAARVARLGKPDEDFATLAPPLQTVKPELLATRVRVSRDADRRDPGRRTVVARTAREIEQASALIEDSAVAAEVAATSSRKHSILILWGADDLESVEELELYADPDWDRLVVHANRIRYNTAVVLRTPRLAREATRLKPFQVTIRDPDHPMSLMASPPG
jgi:hypothetical protein